MAPQADFAKIGYEIEKFFGRQRSFGNGSSPSTQNLCQYKFYPTYGATKVVHMQLEDVKCNEAASRFISEKRTELQMKGLLEDKQEGLLQLQELSRSFDGLGFIFMYRDNILLYIKKFCSRDLLASYV
ncbi:hypothetical protein VNO78_04677 [Psophocarpus tetragonolobus]|uniref:Uncharacterized protein n=1 Tax=Psophocarpus tetragonolobus TaxID=3891 RepID=A0AAN9T259_PSOTE